MGYLIITLFPGHGACEIISKMVNILMKLCIEYCWLCFSGHGLLSTVDMQHGIVLCKFTVDINIILSHAQMCDWTCSVFHSHNMLLSPSDKYDVNCRKSFRHLGSRFSCG